MGVDQWCALITYLERSPRTLKLYFTELQRLIAECMDEVYELAKTGADNDRKMLLVNLEYRSRLLLKRWRKLGND